MVHYIIKYSEIRGVMCLKSRLLLMDTSVPDVGMNGYPKRNLNQKYAQNATVHGGTRLGRSNWV